MGNSIKRQELIRGLNVAFKQDANGHLHHRLSTRLLISVNLVEPDIVFAITSIAELRHCGHCNWNRDVSEQLRQ